MFQRSKERREDIDHEAIGFGQNVTDFLVNQRVEDDRPATVLFRGIIDLLYHGPRFSAVSMYGRVSFVKVMFSNCARRLWPRVSAVMPVPSEMKKAVRFMCLGP